MPDHDALAFEARLADTFDRYVVAAPVDVDARTMAAAIAATTRATPRGAGWPARSLIRPRGVRLALVLGLLALVAAAALIAGSLLLRTTQPLGGGGRILVTYPSGPGWLFQVGGDAIHERKVAVGGCPQVIGNADAVVTNTRFVGIRFGAFDGPSSLPIRTGYAGGERWSPGNRTLALLNWTDGSVTFVSVAGGDVEHPVQVRVPLDLRGIPTSSDGYVVFDGSFSPDGRRMLLVTDPVGDGTMRRLDLLDVRGGSPRLLATLPATAPDVYLQASDVAWAPDHSAVAIVSEVGGVRRVATVSTTTGDVRWLDDLATAPASTDLTLGEWSPDGSRIYGWAGAHLWFVDLATGEWRQTPLVGPVSPIAVSADGRRAAVVSGATLSVVDSMSGEITRQSLVSTLSAWSPDRSALAVLESSETGGSDSVVRLWDPWSVSGPSVAATFSVSEPPAGPAGADGPCIQWLPEAQS